mgnify:CR=1 FL=1
MTKQGYKQTDVGLIPADWKVKKLGDVGEPKMCKRIFNHQTKKRGDIPFFKIGTFGKLPDAFISKELYHRFKRKYSFPKEGTILISAAGTIGRLVIYSGEDAYYQDSNIVWIDNDESLISNEYLKHVFPKIKFRTEGSTINRLYNNILKSGEFPCPTLSEQKAIATALSDADKLMTNLDKLIAKKKDIKKGAMQQLLTPPHKGGKRLPGFEGEWVMQNLKDIIWFQEGPGVRKYQFTTQGVKLLNGTNIQQGVLDLDRTDRYISEKEAFGWYSHFLVDDGDILIACSGITVARFDEKVTIAEKYHLPLCMNTSTMRFKMKSNSIYKGFFMHYLKSSDFKKQIGGQATGSAQLNFGPSHVEKVIMEIPTYNEQKAIAQILSDMDAEITQIETKKEKYQAIKQGMMQELLTGKTRLI